MAHKKRGVLLKNPEVVDDGPYSEEIEEIKSYALSKKKPTARRTINWRKFKTAAQQFLPLKDIAPLLRVSRDTLNNHCVELFDMTSQEVWEMYASDGKRVLASRMYIEAVGDGKQKKGCFQAQKWLSQNHLGMREPERQEPKNNTPESPKQINYSPTVKGYGKLKEGDVEEIMRKYLDIPDQNKHQEPQTKQGDGNDSEN